MHAHKHTYSIYIVYSSIVVCPTTSQVLWEMIFQKAVSFSPLNSTGKKSPFSPLPPSFSAATYPSNAATETVVVVAEAEDSRLPWNELWTGGVHVAGGRRSRSRRRRRRRKVIVRSRSKEKAQDQYVVCKQTSFVAGLPVASEPNGELLFIPPITLLADWQQAVCSPKSRIFPRPATLLSP